LDDTQAINQFIRSSFKPDSKECLKTQRNRLDLLVMETLNGNNSSQNFHKLIKTSSSFPSHCDSIVCGWSDTESKDEDQHVVCETLRNHRTGQRGECAELVCQTDERFMLQHFVPAIEDQARKGRTGTPKSVQFAVFGLSEDNCTLKGSFNKSDVFGNCHNQWNHKID
jgi:hypothetical protein